ncbi:fumarate hydratase [Methanofervidicoccus sp. A16]|uniref:FumA C-terminus/TtdB family hydratase beta subunit n=1 Tax=Methanofervidicoccus sp. A16 TaxID=2607662 RepID=UPI0011888AA3|nr:FumA C-terminus/TtdB family hydratase beta subunit [Methanofervidicoccus sp. A16]AXI25787.1 fumarate hydratase [Methanofervidicoccus sp. A16]
MKLKTPISKDTVYKLKVGDIVYLNGRIYTGRDEAHINIIRGSDREDIKEIVNKLKDGVIYHAGPIMKKVGDRWRCVSIGPTTSARMNEVEEDFIRITGISAIVGKGGMKGDLLNVFKEYGVVYLAAPGGCAALLADAVVDVKGVYLEELGMPEAIWELEVENFGPLIVAMDSHGRSIYEEVNREVMRKLKELI